MYIGHETSLINTFLNLENLQNVKNKKYISSACHFAYPCPEKYTSLCVYLVILYFLLMMGRLIEEYRYYCSTIMKLDYYIILKKIPNVI